MRAFNLPVLGAVSMSHSLNGVVHVTFPGLSRGDRQEFDLPDSFETRGGIGFAKRHFTDARVIEGIDLTLPNIQKHHIGALVEVKPGGGTGGLIGGLASGLVNSGAG